jgi:hypothetical protein
MDKESYERDEGGFGQKNDLFIFFFIYHSSLSLVSGCCLEEGKKSLELVKE